MVAAGGVAANSRLRERLSDECKRRGVDLRIPPLKYCTDNAAMVACHGSYRLAAGQTDSLDLDTYAVSAYRGRRGKAAPKS